MGFSIPKCLHVQHIFEGCYCVSSLCKKRVQLWSVLSDGINEQGVWHEGFPVSDVFQNAYPFAIKHLHTLQINPDFIY